MAENDPPPSFTQETPSVTHRYIRRRARIRGLSFNRLIPNLLTTLGLCAGLSAIKFAFLHNFQHAIIALLIASCIDGIDGRIARLLKGTSRFGAEFDSLSDFVCFGVAPPIVLAIWGLPFDGRFAFIPSAMFTVCMALRLARFNAALDDDTPVYAAGFFSGVPAPAGGGIVLFPVLLGLEAHQNNWQTIEAFSHSPYLVAACLILMAGLLVSTLPVWSFKNFKVPAPAILPSLLGTGLYAALLISAPWAALAGAGILYLCLLPFSRRSYWRLRKEAEEAHCEISTPAEAEDSQTSSASAPKA